MTHWVRNAQTDAESVAVEVQGTKAILRGTVRSWAEREKAARAAWSAPGITSVENDIVISIYAKSFAAADNRHIALSTELANQFSK